jgi:MraZ protein
MFIGEYNHNLDAKGRLIMPAKFRACLGDRCITTRGLDHCLFVFPLEEWRILEEKLRNLPLTKKEARAFSRFFFSGATECELDGQGRILISPSLREYAKVSREVAIIGVSSGSIIFGTGTSSRLIFSGPWYTNAFIVIFASSFSNVFICQGHKPLKPQVPQSSQKQIQTNIFMPDS